MFRLAGYSSRLTLPSGRLRNAPSKPAQPTSKLANPGSTLAQAPGKPTWLTCSLLLGLCKFIHTTKQPLRSGRGACPGLSFEANRMEQLCLKTLSCTPGKLSHSHLASGVCRKKLFLCASVKILCVSVVKLLQKTLTTEAQRSHRGTEIIFPTDS